MKKEDDYFDREKAGKKRVITKNGTEYVSIVDHLKTVKGIGETAESLWDKLKDKLKDKEFNVIQLVEDGNKTDYATEKEAEEIADKLAPKELSEFDKILSGMLKVPKP